MLPLLLGLVVVVYLGGNQWGSTMLVACTPPPPQNNWLLKWLGGYVEEGCGDGQSSPIKLFDSMMARMGIPIVNVESYMAH